MQTDPITPKQLEQSVIAVPPLARNENLVICKTENAKLVRHIENGGVSTLLYGGNANLYHVRPAEYASLLEMLSEIAGENSLVIPSVGPAYGLMMEQAQQLRETDFPTVMVLPPEGVISEAGLLTGFRHFVEKINRPAVLYIKKEGYITTAGAAKLVADGLVSFIKYAIVRDDPSHDEFLQELVSQVDAQMIVSGIGEQPAITHLTKFNLQGFTSGCVCIAPALSQAMRQSLLEYNLERAESIRTIFRPLEDLRNAINPIRVLHDACQLCGIAETGPQLPLLANLDPQEAAQVKNAATELLATVFDGAR